MKIRELFATVGFDIDYDALRKVNVELNAVKQLTSETFSGLSDIARGVRNVGLGLTAGLTVPISLVGVAAVKTEAQVEGLLVRYKVLLGEAGKAKSFLNDLVVTDRNTPGMGLFDVLGYGDKMLMMKFGEKDSVEWIKKFAAASATGTNMSTAMHTLMEQMYQVYNNKTATVQDFRPMANAGLDIYGALKEAGRTGDPTGATFQEMLKAIEVLANRGKDLLGERAGTKSGLWEQLLSVIFEVRLEIGKMIDEVLPIKEVFKWAVGGLGHVVKWLKEMPTWLKFVTVGFTLLLAAIGPLMAILGQLGTAILGILAFKMGIGLFLSTIGTSIAGVTAAISGLSGAIVAATLAALPWIIAIGSIAAAIEDLYRWLKGDESVLGDWLGPWQDWKDNVKRIIGEVVDTIGALWEVMKNPFSSDNWENLKGQFLEAAQPYYSDKDLNNNFWTTSGSPSQMNATNNVNFNNNVTVTVPAGTTEQQIKVIRQATVDSLDLQQQLSHTFFGSGGS